MADPVDFDDYTENYNQLLHEKTRLFATNEGYFARYKVDIVRKQFTSPVGRVLEYGCGIGRNIPFLQNAFPGSIIVGSDISLASLKIAKRDNPEFDFVAEDGNATEMGIFDLIFVAGVFHHIPVDQRRNAARTLFSRLAPDGKLFVFEHNPYNPITRGIVSTCQYDEDAVLLKPSELMSLLSEAEFLVERKAYCLFVPPSLGALTGLENRLGWLPLGGQYWLQATRAA